MDAEDFDAIDNLATSLKQHLHDEPDRSEILVGCIEAVVDAIRGFELDAIEKLVEDFSRFDAFHASEVEVLSADRRIAGVNRGISEHGHLRLETGQGIELYSSAEISLRVAR